MPVDTWKEWRNRSNMANETEVKKIGIVYGMESTFPPALVDTINARKIPGVVAEHLRIGGIKMA